MIKKICYIISIILICYIVSVEKPADMPKKNSWADMVSNLEDYYYQTSEAVKIGNNILRHEHDNGGWGKNFYMPDKIKQEDLIEILRWKDLFSTFDNCTTVSQIRYLAKLYKVTDDERYKEAVINGLNFIFKAQYPNGGWPMEYFRPNPTYHHYITFNDNTMVNIMTLLQDITDNDELFDFIDDGTRKQCKKSYDKGLDCILNLQFKQNGKPTIWADQYDHITLEPKGARNFELPALASRESMAVTEFLMSIKNPSDRVIKSVDSAVEWFENSKITGIKQEFFINEKGKRDYRMVKSPNSPDLWARFYDLDTNKPFFSDRSGKKSNSVDKISWERRYNYTWYHPGGHAVIEEYKLWKKQLNQARQEPS